MRPIVLRTLPKSVTEATTRVHAVLTAMTANPWFPSPTPPLAKVSVDLAALEAGEAAMLTRARVATSVRDQAEAVVRRDYSELAAHVQSIADANPEHAASIVESAGMNMKKPSPRHASPFRVEDGPVPGSVILISRSAGDRASYERESSPDGSTWTGLGITLQTRKTVDGLTLGQTYFFRCRVVSKSGPGDWGDVVSHLVR